MSRITINDKLKNREINIQEEISNLCKVLKSEHFQADVNKSFNKLGEYGFYNSSDMFNKIMYDSNDIHIYNALQSMEEYVDFYFDLSEIILLVVKESGTHNFKIFEQFNRCGVTSVKILLDSIMFIVDSLGYQIVNNDGVITIALKDSLAEEVASLENCSSIRWRILEYNTRKLTLEKKKKILEDLYKVFERDRKKYQQQVATSIADIMNNCIRHSEKNVPYKWYLNNEEEWCDKIYDLMLECFIHHENNPIIEEIRAEKEKEKS